MYAVYIAKCNITNRYDNCDCKHLTNMLAADILDCIVNTISSVDII